MGSPFGTGQYVPNTGVLLNSALRLFSTNGLNQAAPGRRPLVFISPIHLKMTHRKCGIRAGISSFPGLKGFMDMAYVSWMCISNELIHIDGVFFSFCNCEL